MKLELTHHPLSAKTDTDTINRLGNLKHQLSQAMRRGLSPEEYKRHEHFSHACDAAIRIIKKQGNANKTIN